MIRKIRKIAMFAILLFFCSSLSHFGMPANGGACSYQCWYINGEGRCVYVYMDASECRARIWGGEHECMDIGGAC